ncbi:MAG: vWA domain-containing protein [Planctomycetota bacterium]|nr:vWA domain-containing protein [Planctomycetota bacterium]
MTLPLALIEGSAAGARLQLHVSSGFAWTAAIVLIAAVSLSVRAWLRSYRRTSILALEVVRLVLMTAVLFVLAQPEWVVTETPDEAPLVTVLWDDSGSMETRDVESPDGLISRAEAVRARLAELEGPDRGAGTGVVALDSFDLVASPLTVAAHGETGEGPAADGARLGTDLRTPLEALLDQRTLRAVVLLSDGDWNEGGSPYDVATRYRLAGVPIFTAAIGSPARLPDIALAPVDPPTFAIVDRPVDLPVSIDSAMPRDASATVTLRDRTGVVESRSLLVGARRTTTDKFVYRPRAAGRVELTMTVDPQPGELDLENNTRTFEIDVREERLRVLLVEGVPRWEYRYLRNALVRDPGVDVDCYLTHPSVDGVGGGPTYLEAFPPKEALPGYDVIFVGDVGLGDEGLTVQQCEMIAGLVRDQASGLILMPGLGGGHHELTETELGDLFPVDLDPTELHGTGDPAAAPLALTEAGRASSLTRLVPGPDENSALWGELPGFQWHAPVRRARAGSQVLAVHGVRENEYGRIPLLVTRTARTGKVLFMGTDGAWRWREGFEDRYHYRFWGQVIRWMAYQRSMNVGESMRLFFAPDRPRVRSAIALNANVMDSSGAPLGNGTVRARIESPTGRIERITFEPAAAAGDGGELDQGAWGLYSATFSPREPGRHRATLTCEETGAVLEAEIPVVGVPLERRGMPARFDVMEELATLTRGAVLDEPSLGFIAERLRALPPPEPIVTRARIWSHPALGGAIVLLMGLFWIGRKLVGRI